MKHLKFILLFILFLSTGYTETKAQQNVAFADIDLIIKNTNVGRLTLDKINEVNNANIEKLKSFEEEIKIEEDKINKKKNLISKEEFQNEINQLRIKLNEFNKKKNMMSNSFKTIKSKELDNLFKIINPIIQNYMNANSVQILLNSKNIFMGKKEIDLTQQLIDEINNQVKQ